MQSAVRDPATADQEQAASQPSVAPDRGSDTRSGRGGQDDAHTDGRQEKRRGQRQQGSEGRSVAEWVTLGVSSLIVVALLALTTYFYVTASSDPVIIEVEPRMAETYQAAGRYYLPVTVHNRGGETGADVKVRVTLAGADGRQETAELQVQFLAGGGAGHGVVSFVGDPRRGQIEAGVVSYLEP